MIMREAKVFYLATRKISPILDLIIPQLMLLYTEKILKNICSVNKLTKILMNINILNAYMAYKSFYQIE